MKRFFARVGALLFLYRLLFTGYANTGPFVNNAPPGISATFLNNVENFLDTINSAATDSHISADGAGSLKMKFITGTAGTQLSLNSLQNGISFQTNGVWQFHTSPSNGIYLDEGAMHFLTGNISRIAFGFGFVQTGGTTITHGLGVIPSAVFICPSAAGITYFVNSTMTTTTFTATTSSNNNVWWIAIASFP